jgi:uncharacterized Zn finger protein
MSKSVTPACPDCGSTDWRVDKLVGEITYHFKVGPKEEPFVLKHAFDYSARPIHFCNDCGEVARDDIRAALESMAEGEGDEHSTR